MKRLVGLTALSIIVLTAAVMGQTGYPALDEMSYVFQGAGARAFAMGDAFIGLSNDVSSGTWNPAGMWVIESPMISASYLLYKPAGTYTQSLTPVTTKNNLDINAIGHFSFATPVRIKGHPWVFNFNYLRNNENITQATFYEEIGSYTNQLNPNATLEDAGYLRTYLLGMSTRIYKQLSVGLMANIYDGRRVKKQVSKASYEDTISVIQGLINREYREYTSIDSAASNGFNLTLGLMYKLEKFNVGAVVRSPFDMSNSTDYSAFTVARTNGLPNVTLSDSTYVNDSVAKQQIPLSLGFGVAVFPRANITTTFDIVYQRYGSSKWLYRDSTYFSASGVRTDYFTENPIDWNNTIGVGAGVEYLMETKFGQVPLRAGVRYDQLPQPKTFESHNDPMVVGEDTVVVTTRMTTDRQNTVSLSLGTGIRWSQIELGIGYRYTSGAKFTLSDYTGDVLEVKHEIDRKMHEVRFSFTGFFQ